MFKYLKEKKLKYCLDHSNESKDFSRNRIRAELLPLLRRNYNPKVDDALLALADNLIEEENFLETEVSSAYEKIVNHTPGQKLSLDLKQLKRYPSWLRRRLLRYCLKKSCQSITGLDKVVIERLESIVESDNGSFSLPGKYQAEIANGKLYIFSNKKRKVEAQFLPGKKLKLDWPSVNLTGSLAIYDSNKLVKRRQSRKVQLDYNKLELPLKVRSINDGDRFTPLGMTGSKKIGDYLTDKRFPKVCRDECLVLEDQKGIIWLIGFEISDRVKIIKGTKKVLTVAHIVRRKTDAKTI